MRNYLDRADREQDGKEDYKTFYDFCRIKLKNLSLEDASKIKGVCIDWNQIFNQKLFKFRGYFS